MKAERRHELKTNTLAHQLENLPEFGRQYGTKILLAIVAVLAIVVFVRYQARASRDAREQAAETFAAALSGINNLDGVPNMPDGRAAADQRKQIQEQAARGIQQVLDQSKDDALRADALLARGDLNWKLATLPEIRGAETQPSLKLTESDDDLLEKARAAYEAAANTAGASPLTVANARLSLAAVAEEQSKWDEARKHYEQLMADPRTPEPFKNDARVRIEELADISKPILIGKPATRPVTELPELGPPAPKSTTGATTTTAPATTTSAPTEEGPAPGETPVEPELGTPAVEPEGKSDEPGSPEATPPEAPAAPEAPAEQPESGTAPAPAPPTPDADAPNPQ